MEPDDAAAPDAPAADGRALALAGPCTAVRAEAETACAAALDARRSARAAFDRLREARRLADQERARARETREAADRHRLAEEKARLLADWRGAAGAADGPDELAEATARLFEAIDRANARQRAAAARVQVCADDLRSVLAAVDRAAEEHAAIQAAADGAEAACRAAREALAACEEAAAAAEPSPGPHPFDAHWPGEPEIAAVGGPATPAIDRILVGDSATLDRVVRQLAGDDPAEAASWRERLGSFAAAAAARAIEEGWIDLPDEDPFWGTFTPDDRRAIVGTLASLGFRHDGLGGWADDRIPSTRDLVTAVSYAIGDRVRVRA